LGDWKLEFSRESGRIECGLELSAQGFGHLPDEPRSKSVMRRLLDLRTARLRPLKNGPSAGLVECPLDVDPSAWA
jgi:hypothetical protein